MATSVIDHPALPAEIQQGIGLAATQRLEIREQKMTALELQGDIKAATILNLSPFVLDLSSGLIPYQISVCPPDKRFSATTITTCRSYPIYKGNQQMSDKSLQAKFDVNIILPIQQLMEFKHYYVGESDEDQFVKQGGVVVFEGDQEDLRPATMVRVPYFVFRKRNRYIVFTEKPLGDLVNEQEEQLKRNCMSVLDQAQKWYDDEKQRSNIQHREHAFHDFALRKQWITAAMPWRNVQVRSEDRCPRCQQQYVSKTGVCKCSYVMDPFTAYMQGEILVDHVRMNVLTGKQWKAVKEEEKRREEARA
jgi:hypothetical protein